MEVLAEFNDNQGFNVKLTKDKIYVTSLGNEETFALRGVNGVGLYDDIEKYDKEVGEQKNQKYLPAVLYALGGIFILLGIATQGPESGTQIFEGFVCALCGYLVKFRSSKVKMDSYFKLILSGTDRKFKFDKTDETSKAIADFVNKVEDTLTAYS